MNKIKIIFQIIILTLILVSSVFTKKLEAQTKGVDCSLIKSMIVPGPISSTDCPCSYDITFWADWSQASASTNANMPHGIKIEATNGRQITGFTFISNLWFRTGTTWATCEPSSFPGTPSPYVIWYKPTINPDLSQITNTDPNIVTDYNGTGSTQLKVRIFVDNPCNNLQQDFHIKVWAIMGTSYTTPPYGNPDCPTDSTFEEPDYHYIIDPLGPLCSGSDGTLHVIPDPAAFPPTPSIPSCAKIEWYRYDGDGLPGAPPPPCATTTLPLSSDWKLDPGTGNWHPTNQLNVTTCFVAKITIGCYCYYSEPRTVCVDQPLPFSYGITPPSGLTLINDPYLPDNGYHVCQGPDANPSGWEGILKLPELNFYCPVTITWSATKNGTAISLPSSGNQFEQGTGLLFSSPPNCNSCPPSPPSPNGCCRNVYTFTAQINYITGSCPSTTRQFTIYVDKPTTPGKLTADPEWVGPEGNINGPVFCDSGATVLKYEKCCGEIVRWEMREVIGDNCPPYSNWTSWTTIDDAKRTNPYWTNKLGRTTEYRVIVKNGACNEIVGGTIKVTINPKLSVTLSSNPNNICSPPTILTALVSCPFVFGNISYGWYHVGDGCNGLIKTTTTNQLSLNFTNLSCNYTGNEPGYYYVIATSDDDASCYPAQSNVIKVCDSPSVAISGPCGICPGETVTLEAIVEPDQNCNCSPISYLWKMVGTTQTWNTQSINVSSAGTYELTVTCGNCVIKRYKYLQQCQ